MVEPQRSALEKVLVNPVIDGGGPSCAAQRAAANGRARRALTDRPPPGFLKRQAARHEERRRPPSAAPCWREGVGARYGALRWCPAAASPSWGQPGPWQCTGRGFPPWWQCPPLHHRRSPALRPGQPQHNWPARLRETSSGGGQRQLFERLPSGAAAEATPPGTAPAADTRWGSPSPGWRNTGCFPGLTPGRAGRLVQLHSS